jgi:hypothetical protein
MTKQLDGVTMSDDPAAVSAVNRMTREAYLQAATAAEQAGDPVDAAKFRALAVSLMPDGAVMGTAKSEKGPKIEVTPVEPLEKPFTWSPGIQPRSYKPPLRADFFWALKGQKPSVKDALYGSKQSGMRLGSPAKAKPSLGYPPDAQIEADIMSRLASSQTPYDAFVQFVIAQAPDYLKPSGATPWTLDAYQVNEALRSFERNYSLYQDAKDAAAWGLRFPDDMRADIAFKRMKLAEQQWNDMFLGFYEPLTGTIQPPGNDQAVANAKGLIDQLGSDPTFFYTAGYSNYLIEWVYPSITTTKTLTGTSRTLELWYAHVYRSLQYFMPVLAKFLTSAGEPAIDTISAFDVPNLENPTRFASWAVASSFFMFFRFNADKELRGMADDSQLADFAEGAKLAFAENSAEMQLYAMIGQSISKQISNLELLERLLKLAKMPLDLIQGAAGAALNLAGSISWWEWILIAIGGTVAVTATVVAVRKVL